MVDSVEGVESDIQSFIIKFKCPLFTKKDRHVRNWKVWPIHRKKIKLAETVS